jgi:hypothetical protein
LSQRTRDRTTGAAKRNPPERGSVAATPAVSRPARPAMRPDTAEPPAPTADRDGADAALDPTLLARTLRAVADELERDPSLARRVAAAAGPLPTAPAASSSASAPEAPPPRAKAPRAEGADQPGGQGTGRAVGRRFRPRLVTGAAPELGPGIPDPFALHARLGHAGLQTTLAELRLGTLRAMVREHGLDPSGRLIRQNDADRLRALILEAVAR